MDALEKDKRLAIIKYLYLMGCETLLKGSFISKSTCILNFHDSVESFLVLVAEIVGIQKTKLNFLEYFDEIKRNDAESRELSHKMQMKKLNKIRVNFKHMGIMPNEEECNSLRISINDFFVENVPKFCSLDFDQISLANSIQDDEIRTLVQESEVLLNKKDYSGCLFCLGKAFYKLNRECQQDRRHSPVFLQKKVDLFEAGLPRRMQDDVARIIQPVYGPIAEKINIIILGIDYLKYAKFKCLTPRFQMMANGDISSVHRMNEYDTKFNVNRGNTEFCYFFMIDATLKIERFNFGLVSAWEKPDKVSAVSEDNTPLFEESSGKCQVLQLMKKKTIIKLTGMCKSLENSEGGIIKCKAIIVDGKQGWIESSKIIQIDNPELPDEE